MKRTAGKALDLKMWLVGLAFLCLAGSAVAQTSAYSAVNIAGSFNGWNTTNNPLVLIANNTWQGDISIADSSFEFKFTTPAWAANWGDNNQPNTNMPIAGTGDSGGANIKVTNGTDNALFRFTINTSTREFSAFLLNNIGTNLLFNGGFETQGSSQYSGRYWEQNVPNLHGGESGAADRSDYEGGHDGSTWKGQILGTWAGQGNSGSFWQEAPVEPGLPCAASAWFQAESGTWTAAVQELRLDFYDFNRTNVLASFSTNLASVSTSWEQHGVTGAAPARAAWARLVLNVSGSGADGTFRMDDASIEAISSLRTEDFNAWAYADEDGCYLRAGWQVCTGKAVSTVIIGSDEVPLARSGYAASLINPGAVTNGSYIQTPRYESGIGTISFWYRHGCENPTNEPSGPVNLAVQISFLGDVWTTVGEINNISSQTYKQYSLFQYQTTPYYVRIAHNGGSTNRLIVDDISVAEPEALPRLMDFDTWPDSATNGGSHTYLDWMVHTGVVVEADAKAGKAAQLSGSETSNTFLRSPKFSDGYGKISFSYRVSAYSARSAGISLESSPDGTNWVVLGTLTNVAAVTWQDYSWTYYQPAPYHVRIRNIPETNLSDIAIVRISEGFDGGSDTPPAGWTYSDGVSQYDSADYSGAAIPSLKFEQSNAYVSTPSFVAPTNLRFMTRGASISSNSTLAILGLVGTNWNTVSVFTNLTNVRRTNNVALATNITALKFVYSKAAGNLAFDDVFVTGAKLFDGAAPPQTLLLDDVYIEAPNEFRSQNFDSWPLKMEFLTGTTQHENWVIGGQTKVNTNKAFSGQSLQLSRASDSADYYVDFEGASETKGTYPSGTVKLSGIDWDMTEALIGNLSNDWKTGVKSTRIRANNTPSMTMLADKAGGLGTLSFKYRRYGSDAQTNWVVQYSTNAGSTWIQAGSAFTANSNVQTFSQAINVAGNVRIRFQRATTNSITDRRMNIDEILLTGYGGTGGSDAGVQSQYFADGIGPISFQYRHTMDSAPPTESILTTLIQTSSNGINWTTVDTLMVSNTSYRTYERYMSETNQHYVRLRITNGNSVALFDDIVVQRPQPRANVQLSGWNEPTVPFTNDAVTLLAQVLPEYGARGISITSYYRMVIGGLTGAYTAVGMTGDGSTWTAVSNIPPQSKGTIVQYYMKGSFEGPGSDINSPVYYPTNFATSPAWYGIPRNTPGKVWINEIDYDAWDWVDNYEFIELAGETGTDISGWKIELRDGRTAAFSLFGTYTIPASTLLPNDTNSFGFYVLGQANLTSPPRDLLLTNYLSSYVPGAVRLLNEMNGVEASLSYGGSVPSHSRIPVNDVELGFGFAPPTNSVVLLGTGSVYDHFDWGNRHQSPGAANPGQVFADPALISVLPTNLVFSYIADSYSPEAQSLVVSNSGSTPLSYSMASNVSWVTVSPGTADAVDPGSSVVHSVSVTTDGFTGNKTAQIAISGNAGNSPVTVPIQLNETAIGTAILIYNFDEASGLTANNQGTAGQAADLNLVNGATRTLEGGGVSSSEGDYALVSTGATSLAQSTGTVAAVNSITQFTITGWVKTSATGGVHRLLGNRALTSGFALNTASNYEDLALVSSATGAPAAVTSTNGSFTGDTWKFFAVTFDSSDDGSSAVKFYRGDVSNGAFLFSSHARGGLGGTGISTGQFLVAGNNSDSFQGNLDAMRFFSGVKDLMAIEAIRREDVEGGGGVLVPPSIQVQPQSITNNVFTPIAQLGVTASGTPAPEYQWRKGGAVLGGQTAGTISFTPLLQSDAGDYDVIVYNVAGSVTSQVAVVVVLAPPEVLSVPTSLVVYVGETITLAVNATGTPPMRYQWNWQFGPIAGETNPNLVLVNVQTDQAGIYNVSISNRVALSNSVTATMTVRELNIDEGGWIQRRPGVGGNVMRWPAISNRWYEVWWSSNLLSGISGFVPVTTNMPLLSGTNFMIYTDTVRGVEGRGFYQIRARMTP